jgi:hypothetical protein
MAFSSFMPLSTFFQFLFFHFKVLTSHYENAPDDRAAYFGFLLPVRWAVWAELLLIQLMLPNASFIGHLGRLTSNSSKIIIYLFSY